MGEPGLSQPWPGARVSDGQYVPKNKLLRPPGSGGSPMQTATPEMFGGKSPAEVRPDPACGVLVQEADAVARGLVSEFKGQKYYFSTAACKQAFDKDPGKYISK